MYIGSDFKDKTVSLPSYLYKGNHYIGKTASLYWDGTPVSSRYGKILWAVEVTITYFLDFNLNLNVYVHD